LIKQIAGLVAGTTYKFRVYAVNKYGDSLTPKTLDERVTFLPAPPTNLKAKDGTKTASVVTMQWTLPTNNGGSPITKLVLTHTPTGGQAQVYNLNTDAVEKEFVGFTESSGH